MNSKSSSLETPAQLNYRWPAEWEPHTATWLAWPHNPDTWPGKFEIIPPIYAEFVKAVAQFETVRLLVGKGQTGREAQEMVGHVANVELVDIETNDAWVRDHGPIFLKSDRKQKALVDWQYNAWGNKYPPFDKDNAVSEQITQRYQHRRFVGPMVLEGGAIEGNGAGTLLTTESCLLNPNRNPRLEDEEIERNLREYLGVKKILWLSGGDFTGDDTDGHIDQLARFTNATTIAYAACDDEADENFEMLALMKQELESLRLADGQRPTLVPLPIPLPKFHDGHRLPTSYCNFYIVNGGVIVPQFDDPADEVAVERLTQLLPDRRIIGLPALDLVWGLGAFHCLSQQEPA